MAQIRIYGESHDRIEIDGDFVDEFYVFDGKDTYYYLGFSEGTVLQVHFNNDGVWKITPIRYGTATYSHTRAEAIGDGHYSDRVKLTGDIKWVVLGKDVCLGARVEAKG